MNRLTGSTSPYLLQHATNPVDWWPWCTDALAEAKRTGKPILLSIGYSACHWCHVMAYECFEDPEIAAQMNELFVNIKVDREERPDIDQIYMAALNAISSSPGWPLTMFLDSAAHPFWGGTYFPPSPRHGQPGFPQVLQTIALAYQNRERSFLHNADALSKHLAQTNRQMPAPVPARIPAHTAAALMRIADPANAGIAGAPKFPNVPILDFLWRQTGDARKAARSHVLHTLQRISLGGIYDHIAGGYCRYSVDERWLVPHFEKMLYDNALLLIMLTRAYQATRAPLLRSRIEQTVEWLNSEMLLPDGAYASSLDADTAQGEGAYYLWSQTEIAAALGDRASAFCQAYDINPIGHIDGKSIPNLLASPDPQYADVAFQADRKVLLEARRNRQPPARDDKILTDWNALAIRALAEAGTALARPDWITRAREAFAAILSHDLAQLPHSSMATASTHRVHVRPAMASDYACLARAAISLNQATLDPAYIATATSLITELDAHYASESSPGYALASIKAPDLILRPTYGYDDAIPNYNAAIAETLSFLSQATGEATFAGKATKVIEAFGSAISENPPAHCGLLSALDAVTTPIHVTVTARTRSDAAPLIAAAQSVPEPNLFVEVRLDATGRAEARAIVCVATHCSSPIQDPLDLRDRISARTL